MGHHVLSPQPYCLVLNHLVLLNTQCHSPKLFGVGRQSCELHPPPSHVERVDDGHGGGGRDGAARRHVRQSGGGERLVALSVDGGRGEPVKDVKLDAVRDGYGEQAGGEPTVKSPRTALLDTIMKLDKNTDVHM